MNTLTFEQAMLIIQRLELQQAESIKKLDLLLKYKAPVEDKIYTLPEAAETLKMAVPTFRIYLKNGTISGTRLEKKWLFRHSELEAFLDLFRVGTYHDLMKGGCDE